MGRRSSRCVEQGPQHTPLIDREEADTKEGVALGVHAVNPVNGERIPCFVAPYVLMEYGTGAIMARARRTTSATSRSRAQHGLPIRVVIQPDGRPASTGDAMTEAYAARGRDGELRAVRRRAVARVDRARWPPGWRARAAASRRCTFRLRDWLISAASATGARRSRSSTARRAARSPVPDDQLPVLLPDDVDFQPGGESPLARHPTW